MSKRTLLIIAILLRRLERKKRNNRKKIFQDRRQRGEFHLLIYDLRLHEYFFSFMNSVLFLDLLT